MSQFGDKSYVVRSLSLIGKQEMFLVASQPTHITWKGQKQYGFIYISIKQVPTCFIHKTTLRNPRCNNIPQPGFYNLNQSHSKAPEWRIGKAPGRRISKTPERRISKAPNGE